MPKYAESCAGIFKVAGTCRERQVMSNSDKSKFIVINFDKAHRISTITPVGLTEDELEKIRDDIKQKLVDNQHNAVGQTVLFCGGRLEGRFQYKGDFQMVPVPKDAPQLEHAFGAHPYLLQTPIQKEPGSAYQHPAHSQTCIRIDPNRERP